jgi:SAM-dependent methyltransferase
LTVLEFGCGPGTGVAGMWAWARRRGLTWRHHATDVVPQALDATRALAETLGVEGVTTSRVGLAQRLAPRIAGLDPADIVLMMNVVNELSPTLYPDLTASLGHALAPGGALVVIEPAAFEPSRRTLAFRDALVNAEWAIRASDSIEMLRFV